MVWKFMFPAVHPLVYFGVWTALAVGTSILYWVRRDAEFRIRWYARIGLVTGVLIGLFMFLAAPALIVLLLMVFFGGCMIYLSISKTTICTKCGKIVQPDRLVLRVNFCPRCGGKTVCSKLFA
jgi:DNA-directed RNA polymerase subunit RPC12/RpoP